MDHSLTAFGFGCVCTDSNNMPRQSSSLMICQVADSTVIPEHMSFVFLERVSYTNCAICVVVSSLAACSVSRRRDASLVAHFVPVGHCSLHAVDTILSVALICKDGLDICGG